jgi:3-deoxy-alpha-D-manno-octulosonate 8-oxidase
MYKNFKSVSKCVFGRGSFNQLDGILAEKRSSSDSYVVFLLDNYFKDKALAQRIPLRANDQLIYINVDEHEPTTEQIDELNQQIRSLSPTLPVGLVGIGGGSVMDIAKATSMMLTNEGLSTHYQGLNLIKNQGVFHVGIPTLAGTGAEVSMTAVLTGPTKKLGIKCDYTVFDQIILDSELVANVPQNQWFYTGMDTYIHCIESLQGTMLNEFSKAYGIKSLELCREVFNEIGQSAEGDEKLMIASYMGGLSLTYSEVGVCHALSYGLSYVFGYRHGIANCIAFDELPDYYGEAVTEFKGMVKKHNIHIPKGLSKNWTEEEVAKMAQTAYALEHMWKHAVGAHWKEVITKEKIMDLYYRM